MNECEETEASENDDLKYLTFLLDVIANKCIKVAIIFYGSTLITQYAEMLCNYASLYKRKNRRL